MTIQDVTALLAKQRRGDRNGRLTLRAILLLDMWQGGAWLFGDPNRTAVPLFKPAREFIDHHVFGFDPARVWGCYLFATALLALVVMELWSEFATRMAVVAVCFFWTFWLVLNIYSAFLPKASLTAWASAAIVLIGHIRAVVGSHRMTRRATPAGG